MPKMVHSCIRVLDDVGSIDWYRRAFDLEIVDQLDFESFRLTYMANAETDFELELTLNKDRIEPYNLGDGYGHIAVVVDDAESYHNLLNERDCDIGELVDFAPAGELVARFFFATDPDGYKIEVIQKGGRFK